MTSQWTTKDWTFSERCIQNSLGCCTFCCRRAHVSNRRRSSFREPRNLPKHITLRRSKLKMRQRQPTQEMIESKIRETKVKILKSFHLLESRVELMASERFVFFSYRPMSFFSYQDWNTCADMEELISANTLNGIRVFRTRNVVYPWNEVFVAGSLSLRSVPNFHNPQHLWTTALEGWCGWGETRSAIMKIKNS